MGIARFLVQAVDRTAQGFDGYWSAGRKFLSDAAVEVEVHETEEDPPLDITPDMRDAKGNVPQAKLTELSVVRTKFGQKSWREIYDCAALSKRPAGGDAPIITADELQALQDELEEEKTLRRAAERAKIKLEDELDAANRKVEQLRAICAERERQLDDEHAEVQRLTEQLTAPPVITGLPVVVSASAAPVAEDKPEAPAAEPKHQKPAAAKTPPPAGK